MADNSIYSLISGIGLATSPLTVNQLSLNVNFSPLAQLSAVIYGLLIVVGSILVSNAEHYKLLFYAYALGGVAALFAGPLTGFPAGQGFWTTITALTAIFAGLPSVMLLHLDRKDY